MKPQSSFAELAFALPAFMLCMSMTDHPAGNANPPIRRLYWICQFAGWSVLALFGTLSAAVFSPGEQPSTGRLVAAVLLVCCGGLAVTHLLYLQMRRRQWLRMPFARVWPRLVAATALSAVMVTAIGIVVNIFVVRSHVPRQLLRPGVVLVLWVNYCSILALWMAFYLAIYEFRRRRATEVHALRLELVAQEAQLRGMRAQLNPHFLFNCLNSLRELIVEDPGRAQTMVTQLAGLLRYSLQSNQAEQVLLADEVQAVKDYLALEAIRFEERLHVAWEVAADTARIPVPPMLLQTLVENALKHGIANRPDGGEISIRAQIRDDHLELEVVNTGELPEHPPGNGIGLRNARTRLQLLYGDQATIVLANAARGKVRALGSIPFRRAGSAP